MASPAASSVLLLLLAAFAAGASASTITITNRCSYTVWPAAIAWPPAILVGSGVQQLDPGQTTNPFDVPAGTSSGRVWGRTGCNFNGGGGCQTGDCAGALYCSVSGQPPTTLAEFTIGSTTDSYYISVIDGFNVPMDFGCSTGVTLRCRDASCPDAYHQPNDRKTYSCNGNSDYQVVFCP